MGDVNLPDKLEWMHCPTGIGELRFHKQRFAEFLAASGVTDGVPPTLPKWCVEEAEPLFSRAIKLGLAKWTYFARGLDTGRIKIGMSKDPARRVADMRHVRYGEAAELLVTLRGGHFESAYHDAFRDWHEGHEWFAPHPDILAEVARIEESKS